MNAVDSPAVSPDVSLRQIRRQMAALPVKATAAAPSDLEQFRAALTEHQRQIEALVLRATPAPILTLTEAIPYTKHESDSAFYRWCAKWRVTACAQGRYARGQLDRAMQREAATRRKKAA